MGSERVITQRLTPVSGALRSWAPQEAPGEDPWSELRPRGVGELIDQCFAVFVAHFGFFVGFAVLVFVPFHLFFDAYIQSLWNVEGIGQLRDLLPAALTSGLVTLCLGERLLGRPQSIGTQARRAVKKLPWILGFRLLSGLASLLLCCVLVLPGLLSQWFFAPALAVYLLEGRALVKGRREGGQGWIPCEAILLSLRRSTRLAWGWESFVRFLGVALVAGLVILLPLMGIAALQESSSLRAALLSSGFFDARSAQLVMLLLGAVAMAVTAVFYDIFFTLYYLDLRVRMEALDLEQELGAIIKRNPVR